MRLLTKNWR